MKISLRQLTLDECQQVRVWRNAPDVLPMLRTGFKTEEQQAAFYRDVVLNPWSPHHYYALEYLEPEWAIANPNYDGFPATFIGMGGLTYLDRVPGQGEISLILGPRHRGQGLGTAAVEALLAEAYGPLGLTAVVGECFEANPARGFWSQLLERLPPVSRSWRWER